MAEWIVELGDGNIHIKKMSPLVRCKDCKFWKHQGWKSGWCEQFNGAVTADDGYCFLGKRREAESNMDQLIPEEE